MHALEHGPLLDMQFDVSGRVLLFLLGIGEFGYLDATAAQRVFHLHAVAVGADAIRINGMCSSKGRGAKQATAKTCALFVCPVHKAHRNRGTAAKFGSDSP